MSLKKLSLLVAGQDRAQVLAQLLCEIDPAAAVSAFAEEASSGQWRVEAYHLSCALPSVARTLSSVAPQESQQLTVEAVPDGDWVAISQSALPPVAAGRFLIHGSHDRAVAEGRSRHAIEIEAGEAFGTAHHDSTRGCLVALDRLVRRRAFRRVLDLGCGSGILAIAAARASSQSRVLASDIDPRAIAVARENARLNRVAARTRFICAADLCHPALRQPGKFDLVLVNILAEPLVRFAQPLRNALSRGGYAVMSGLLASETRRINATYHAAGFAFACSRTLNGWTTLTFRRR